VSGELQATRNRLLALLPARELELLPKLEHVELELNRVIFEPDAPLSYVYFPIDALISLSAILEDGTAIEIATIGNEGMAGLPAFLETDSLPFQAICQVAGDALRMRVQDLTEYLRDGATLNVLLRRYTQALFVQVGQSAVCNRVHAMEERCARWLLQTHDRVGDDEFNITHEFLAEMLGVRRASVSVAAGELQKAGHIQYNRGRVTIVDREGLERSACECYAVVREEYERLLGRDAFDVSDT
jgi:CRP-like cAMP-binding protein